MSPIPKFQEEGLESAEVCTTIYINEIPQFVEAELQRLYAHIHASILFIKLFKSPVKISVYVARRGETPIAVLPFVLGRRSIVVLTHMIRLDSIELERFAACAFDRFPSVGVISFKSVQTDLSDFPYPVMRGHSKEDVIIKLPSTADGYTASLGKSTRRNLRRYRARLEEQFPSVSLQSYEKTDIDEQIIRDLIKLSELRITAKRISFGIDSNYARGIIELAKLHGVLNVIWIDGRLCAGMISYRIGTRQYAEVIAHDETYNDFSPGMYCYYWAICESIARGVRTFHMGSGRPDYKIWLLGVREDMEKIEIYRSLAAITLNCDWVIGTLSKAFILKLKTWLRNHEKSLPVRFLLEAKAAMRKMTNGR